jgi:hypothetical protein
MSSRTCTTCGTIDLTGGCGMNAVEWGPTNDGMMEARLLTMLEAKTPVDTIMEELRVCEAWLGHAMLLVYTEELCDIVCTL